MYFVVSFGMCTFDSADSPTVVANMAYRHTSCEAPDSASRLVSFDADAYSHNVEVRNGDAESGASCMYVLIMTTCALWSCGVDLVTRSCQPVIKK